MLCRNLIYEYQTDNRYIFYIISESTDIGEAFSIQSSMHAFSWVT